MAMASTIRAFPKEKAIVSSELASKMYGTLPYFVGKALSEIPQTAFFNSLFGVVVSVFTGLNNNVKKLRRFLGLNSIHGLTAQSVGLLIGAISPNSDTALALFPAILVLNIIFDGKNISEENIPKLLRWVPKVGLIRWGFEGLCLNEFEGLEFDTKGPHRGPVARERTRGPGSLWFGRQKTWGCCQSTSHHHIGQLDFELHWVDVNSTEVPVHERTKQKVDPRSFQNSNRVLTASYM